MPASAAEPPARATRLLWREVAAYLELTPAQQAQLRDLQGHHAQRMQQLSEQARRLPSGSASRGAPEARSLCGESTRASAALQQQTRELLTAEQLTRLARLEQAFLLMPVIESAQAAGLLADRLTVPPPGMPHGQVDTEASWLRVQAKALPGCPPDLTTVHPELGRDNPVPLGQQPRR